jgi:hypothetical protein
MGSICGAVCFLPLLLGIGFLLARCLRDIVRGQIPTFWSPVTRAEKPKTFWIVAVLNVAIAAYLLFGIVMFEVVLIFGPN